MDDGDVNGAPAVLLAGELDLATAPRVEVRLGELVGELGDEAGGRIAVDMRRLAFVDSSGVAALARAQRKAAASGVEIVLVTPSSRCREILEILGLTDLFTIVE